MGQRNNFRGNFNTDIKSKVNHGNDWHGCLSIVMFNSAIPSAFSELMSSVAFCVFVAFKRSRSLLSVVEPKVQYHAKHAESGQRRAINGGGRPIAQSVRQIENSADNKYRVSEQFFNFVLSASIAALKLNNPAMLNPSNGRLVSRRC